MCKHCTLCMIWKTSCLPGELQTLSQADTALLLPSYSELLSISSILTPVAQFYGGTTEGYIE